MYITLLSKISNLASVCLFTDDFRLVCFILGLVAGADLGMIFAALVFAAGKDKDE